MADDPGQTIDCPNCGRANPGWAQVCRNCGFSLRRGVGRPMGPSGRFPTDQMSLLSIGAVLGSIVLAIALGLFFASVNPTSPTVGVSSSPTPSPTPSALATPTLEPTPTPEPTATATPALPASITFGTGLDSKSQVTGQTDTFGSSGYFAYRVTSTTAFGVSTLYETVVRVMNDGSEQMVQNRETVSVSTGAKSFAVRVSVSSLLSAWNGAGTFVMRLYKGTTLIAEGQFTLGSS
jgi:hypothetical protein